MAVMNVEVPDKIIQWIGKDVVVDYETLTDLMTQQQREEDMEWFDNPEFVAHFKESIEKWRADIEAGRCQVYNDGFKANLLLEIFAKK